MHNQILITQRSLSATASRQCMSVNADCRSPGREWYKWQIVQLVEEEEEEEEDKEEEEETYC